MPEEISTHAAKTVPHRYQRQSWRRSSKQGVLRPAQTSERKTLDLTRRFARGLSYRRGKDAISSLGSFAQLREYSRAASWLDCPPPP
jgi:hypothetical protein